MKNFLFGKAAIWIIWIAVLFLLWNLAGTFAIPNPAAILDAWINLLLHGGLLFELWTSFKLNVEALFLSLILSVGFAFLTAGSITGRPSWFDRFILVPISALSKFRFFGMVGFEIVFTRIFGGGHGLKVAILVFGISVFFLTSMIDVVSTSTKEEFDLTRSLKMGKFRGILEVVCLGKLDQTFDVFRQNAAMGWMMLTMVEKLLQSEGGVGVMMVQQNKFRELAPIFAIQLTILAIGICQDQFICWLKDLCCPHSKLALEKK